VLEAAVDLVEAFVQFLECLVNGPELLRQEFKRAFKFAGATFQVTNLGFRRSWLWRI